MSTTEKLKNLLERVSLITTIYNERAKLTGENFNIFKVLGMTSSEVKTHSAFIAELLNPEGSHGMGNIFLKKFIKILKDKISSEIEIQFDIENMKPVEPEHWLGYKTDTNGGYIDILLSDNSNNHIIIENKIYAGDQENQLLRYHNFNPKAPLIYLTLDGKEPTEFSTNKNTGIHKKLICLSYRTDILNWLEKSKKYTVDHPILRETITQYINLIKYLTKQTMKEDEKQEIISTIIKNQEYIEALKELQNNNIWDGVLKKIMDELKEQILGKEGIGKELKLEVKFNSEKDFGSKEFDFWFYKADWKYCIYFEFIDNHYTINYGIDVLDNNQKREPEMKRKLEDALQVKSQNADDWMWKSEFTEYENTSWYELHKNGKELFFDKINDVIRKIEKLMN